MRVIDNRWSEFCHKRSEGPNGFSDPGRCNVPPPLRYITFKQISVKSIIKTYTAENCSQTVTPSSNGQVPGGHWTQNFPELSSRLLSGNLGPTTKLFLTVPPPLVCFLRLLPLDFLPYPDFSSSVSFCVQLEWPPSGLVEQFSSLQKHPWGQGHTSPHRSFLLSVHLPQASLWWLP